MRILIVEDDFVSRSILSQLLSDLGTTDVAVNGREAVEAVTLGIEEKKPYDLICLDIMMPEMNGKEALQLIRETEAAAAIEGLGRAKIVMTTALNTSKDIMAAFRDECDGYLVKPIHRQNIVSLFNQIGITVPSSWVQPGETSSSSTSG